MFSLSSLIEKKPKKNEKSIELDTYSLMRLSSEILEEILPVYLSKQIKVVGYKDGVIKIQCNHPAFGMLFYSYEEEIFARLNSLTHHKYIERFFVFAQ